MPMYNPAHPGALVRGNVEELDWTVTECARKLGVARNTLSRLLNERIGVSPVMALGLEQLGWSDADFWMSLQSAYDLAQEWLRREAMERKAKKSPHVGKPRGGPLLPGAVRPRLQGAGRPDSRTASGCGVFRLGIAQSVSGAARLRFAAGEAVDTDLPNYRNWPPQEENAMPMYDPAHPGAILRDSVEETGWTVTECARRLGVARNTLSRLLNERIGISPAMALGLEQLGWSTADFWMRVQAAYDLAQERLRQEATK